MISSFMNFLNQPIDHRIFLFCMSRISPSNLKTLRVVQVEFLYIPIFSKRGFPKMEVPLVIIRLNGIFHKPSVLGYPHDYGTQKKNERHMRQVPQRSTSCHLDNRAREATPATRAMWPVAMPEPRWPGRKHLGTAWGRQNS